MRFVRIACALAAALAAGAARGFDESADGERTREPAREEKVEWKLTTVRTPWVQAVLGAQYASEGFLGGGVAAAIGDEGYGLLGVSRTNEKPCFRDCRGTVDAQAAPVIHFVFTGQAGGRMGTRTVRLDDDAERALARLRRLTGLSISEVLKRGLAAYEQAALREPPVRPYDVYARLDLGRGGWAVAPAREAKRAVRDVIRRKHAR